MRWFLDRLQSRTRREAEEALRGEAVADGYNFQVRSSSMDDAPHFRANPAKALETLVFIVHEAQGLPGWRLLKVVYYADKRHLERYGRSVTGDRYIAMQDGPVPSLAYDLVKLNGLTLPEPITGEAAQALERKIETRGWQMVRATRAAKMEMFSRTDIECLRWALSTFGTMPWAELHKRAHAEPAYRNAPLNAEMSLEDMIDASVPDRDELIKHLRETADAIEF